MEDTAALEEIIATARRVLSNLERKAAGYTSLSIPSDLNIELEDKRKEVERLEQRLEKAKSLEKENQQASQDDISYTSPIRARVPDKYYIERERAKNLFRRFAEVLEQPEGNPLVFNIYGIGGVGKSTLLGRLIEAYQEKADFLEVCFAKTSDIETPLKLMRCFFNQASRKFGMVSDDYSFAQTEKLFEETLFQLSSKTISGEATSNEEARKITSWFERIIWLDLTGLSSATTRANSFDTFNSGLSTLATVGEDAESLKETIQQRVRNHPATKDKPQLQALMLEPVTRLTQAFAASLMQVAQNRGKSLVLVLDTYEKSQSDLNQWFWQYLVEDTSLDSTSVRFVVVGRKSLIEDEGWQKLSRNRTLLYDLQLKKFDKKVTENYLKQIGIKKGRKTNDIYKITQGLPYYLDWVRTQIDKDEELDFSVGNQAIAKLLFQGLNLQQRKILQLVSCCRWFDLSIIRYLFRQENLGLQLEINNAESYYEWLKGSDFVEFSKRRYRLDEVARDVFRQSYFLDEQNQFRQVNGLLADYFKQQAEFLYDSPIILTNAYEDEEWRRLMSESLYYGFFCHGAKGLDQYIEQVLIAVYLREPNLFTIPFGFIGSEINKENDYLLPNLVNKFFSKFGIILRFGWFFLDKNLDKIKLEFKTKEKIDQEKIETSIKKIQTSLQSFLDYVRNLQAGLGKSIGLIYKSIHCKSSRELNNSLSEATSQIEQLSSGNYNPKLIYSLLLTLGDLQREVELYEESLASYEKSLEFGSDNTFQFLLGQGCTLGMLARYKEALENFQQAKELNSQSIDAWRYQGDALFKLERYEEAFNSYQQAINLDPQSIDAWRYQGDALFQLERYEESLNSYQEAIDLDPQSINAWISRESARRNLRLYEKSLKDVNQALTIDSQNTIALNSQALTLSLLKDFDRAIAAIDRAISLDPEEVLYRANRGIILARAEGYPEALIECERAIAQNPKHESGYYAKACCYALNGETDRAIDNLKIAIEIATGNSRREAKYNPDFDSIKDNELFRSLVYPEPES